MKLFDWNEKFVLSYYISYYSIECEMAADNSCWRYVPEFYDFHLNRNIWVNSL